MGLLDALKSILGVAPVNVGELNRSATGARSRAPGCSPPVGYTSLRPAAWTENDGRAPIETAIPKGGRSALHAC